MSEDHLNNASQEDETSDFDEYDEDVELPRRKGKMWTSVVFALVATLAVVGLLLIHVWSRYRVLSLGYEVSELSRERETLLEENRRLRIEMQVSTRTDRLEPIAHRQLVLRVPEPEQILYVPASQLPLPDADALTPQASRGEAVRPSVSIAQRATSEMPYGVAP